MDNNTITLKEWLNTHKDIEDKRELYLYGDMALNYLHNKGVEVSSFDPEDIDIIDGDVRKVKFNYLTDNKNYDDLKTNLYEYSKLGIRMYLDYYDYLDDSFLKTNYNEFSFGLPKDDVNYFKGIIQRGSFVYFNEFDFELRKKKLKELGEEVTDSIDMSSFTQPNNDIINREIYGDNPRVVSGYGRTKTKSREAAFAEFMVYPVILSFIVGVILLIAFVIFGLN